MFFMIIVLSFWALLSIPFIVLLALVIRQQHRDIERLELKVESTKRDKDLYETLLKEADSVYQCNDMEALKELVPIALERIARQRCHMELDSHPGLFTSKLPKETYPYYHDLRDGHRFLLARKPTNAEIIAIHGFAERVDDRVADLTRAPSLDGFTGLYNKAYLGKQLGKELARYERHGHPFSLIFLDGDHFKRINDEHGHQAGDEVIQAMANALKKHHRFNDTIARFGGDEFSVLLPETDQQHALELAELLTEEISSIRTWGKDSWISPTVSVGVATLPVTAAAIEELLEAADAAMYQAKAAGGNQVAVAPPLYRKSG